MASLKTPLLSSSSPSSPSTTTMASNNNNNESQLNNKFIESPSPSSSSSSSSLQLNRRLSSLSVSSETGVASSNVIGVGSSSDGHGSIVPLWFNDLIQHGFSGLLNIVTKNFMSEIINSNSDFLLVNKEQQQSKSSIINSLIEEQFDKDDTHAGISGDGLTLFLNFILFL